MFMEYLTFRELFEKFIEGSIEISMRVLLWDLVFVRDITAISTHLGERELLEFSKTC